MSEIIADMDGDAPEPVGEILATLGEFNPGDMAGLVPELQGSMSGTVASNGDRTTFVAIQEPALAGFKHITKGPGYLIAGAGEDAQKVFLIDATGFRSLRIESESVKLDGKIRALDSSDDYIFAYVVDDNFSIRRLYVLQNQPGLAIDYIFDLDYDESSAWVTVNEGAGLVAYPVGVGRLEIRRVASPFTKIASVPCIGRSAVAHWSSFPVKARQGGVPTPPPTDYQNLWDFASLVGLAQDYTGAEKLDDLGPENIDMDFGFAIPMRVSIGASFPDGPNGAIFSVKRNTPEPAYFRRASIDFAADGAFSIFGYVDAWDRHVAIGTSNYVVLAQGSVLGGMCLFKEVQYNAGSPIFKIKFQTVFDTGVETLEFLTVDRVVLSIAITQTATRAELWIDGVLEDFIEPIGATAIAIPNGDYFTLGGSEFGNTYHVDTRGNLGQLWKRYNRAISGDEVGALIRIGTNTASRGMIADYYFGNTSLAWDYGPDGKMFKITGWTLDAGAGGTAFVTENAGLKLEYQMLIAGAGPFTFMCIGFRNNAQSSGTTAGVGLSNLIVKGNGDVVYNATTLGNIGVFGAGDVVGCRMDQTVAPHRYEFRINNGAWTSFQVELHTSFLDPGVLMWFYQLSGGLNGTAQMLSTVAEMLDLGEPISVGYSEWPTAGE